MTLVPQLSQQPNARAKTRRRTLADGMESRGDLAGTLNDLDEHQWEDTLIKSALHKATGGLFDKLLGK